MTRIGSPRGLRFCRNLRLIEELVTLECCWTLSFRACMTPASAKVYKDKERMHGV